MAYKPKTMKSYTEESPAIRAMLNISPLFDVITGSYQRGKNGATILNGGMMNVVAIAGEGNTSKSTIANSIVVRLLSRHPYLSAATYDTEGNFQVSRMEQLGRLYNLEPEQFYGEEARYSMSSNIEMNGEEWFEGVKDLGNDKIKDRQSLGTTPFIDPYSKNGDALKVHYPTIHVIDSLSEFQTSSMSKKMEKNEIDDSDLNTYYAQSALQKSKMVGEMPKLLARSNQFAIMTIHVEDEIQMGSVAPQRKKLTYMRQGQKFKGVSKNVNFLTQHCWEITRAAPLYNSDRSAVMYPSKETGGTASKTELLEVTIQGLRNKTGLSGIPITFVVSQAQGLLFGLSYYHHLNKHGFLEQKGHSFTLPILPDKVMMRTNIRDDIAEDARLERALELACEVALQWQYHDGLNKRYRLKGGLGELYDLIKEKGFDWEKIYETRGYWLFDEEEKELNPKPYLNGFDLLRMAVDGYTPHWYKK